MKKIITISISNRLGGHITRDYEFKDGAEEIADWNKIIPEMIEATKTKEVKF